LTSGARPPVPSQDWHTFLKQTYGSCAGLDLERPDQGDLEQREGIE
jgi:hypothetical protein